MSDLIQAFQKCSQNADMLDNIVLKGKVHFGHNNSRSKPRTHGSYMYLAMYAKLTGEAWPELHIQYMYVYCTVTKLVFKYCKLYKC